MTSIIKAPGKEGVGERVPETLRRHGPSHLWPALRSISATRSSSRRPSGFIPTIPTDSQAADERSPTAHGNTDRSAVWTFSCHRHRCAERKGQQPAGLLLLLLLLLSWSLHLGAGSQLARPCCSHPWGPAAPGRGDRSLRSRAHLPEHLLTHFCGCPASSFLSPPGSRSCVGVTCSSEPEAAPRRVGTGDHVLTSLPNSSEVGRVGTWRRRPPLSPGYSGCRAASPRQLGARSKDIARAAAGSPGLGSGVLGWSPASSTHSGCVVLAKLPSVSEPCSLCRIQAAGGRGRFREVEGRTWPRGLFIECR